MTRFVKPLISFLLLVPTFSLASTCPKSLQFLASDSAIEDPVLVEIQEVREGLEGQLTFPDPFVWATNVEVGVAIWHRLCTHFPLLTQVTEAVYQAYQTGNSVPDTLERGVINEAKKLLKKAATSDRDAMAGAIKALLKLEEIRSRDLPPAEENKKPEEKPKDQKPQPQQKPQPGSDGQQSEGQQQKPPQPEYPDPMRSYQAQNRGTKPGSPVPRVPLATVNKAGIAYFRMAIFQLVNPETNRWGQTTTTSSAQLEVTQVSQYSVRVFPLSKKGKTLPLLIPQGFLPVTFRDKRNHVFRDKTGNYFFKTDSDFLDVPLLPQGVATRPLSKTERDIYTAPNSVPLSAWPQHLQNFVEELQVARREGKFSGPDGDVRLAEVLGSYIAHKFTYRVDPDPVLSAMELAHKGVIVCDTPSTILVSLLRKEFQIAARAVGGFRGMRLKGDLEHSHVISPTYAHAWTEVADEMGNWHGVDPTPLKPERTLKKSPAKDDFENQKPNAESPENGEATEQTDQPGSPDQQSQSPQAGTQAGGEPMPGTIDGTPRDNSRDSGKTLAELIKEIEERQGQRRVERNQESGRQAGSQSGKETEEGQSPNSQQNDPVTNQARQVSDEVIRSIEERNPLVQRMMTRLVAWALDPSLSGKLKQQRLGILKGILGDDSEQQFPSIRRLKAILSQATTLFVLDRLPFEKWLESILSQRQIPLNTLGDELAQIQRQMEFTLPFLDVYEREPLLRILRELAQVRRELGRIRHKDSEAIRVAIELEENLPGQISRRIIRDQFGIGESLGDNVGTISLARAISQGKLNEYRLSSILGPHTNFVVDPIPRPRQGERRTWESSQNRRHRQELLPTSDPRVRNRIRFYEHLTDDEALARGEMYYLTTRRRVPYTAGTEDSEPEKATVILLDTSGSMFGDNAYFQSMYVGALVDRALSDVAADGRPRHRVYVVPFDTKPHSEVEVKTAKEAIDFVQNVRKKTGNTSGGTDIQAALLRAAKILKNANQKGDKVLSRATVVLCSDGQSDVDAKKVKQAFDDVGNRTNILMAFVAIGGINPELMSLARTDLGSELSMYIPWDTSDIADIIAKSQAPAKAINDFWTNHSWNNLPREVTQALTILERALGQFRAQSTVVNASRNQLHANAIELQRRSEIPVINRASRRQGSYYGRFSAFRRFLNEVGPRIEARDRVRLLDEVFAQWPALVPESMNELDHQELAALHFIFGWPSTGVAGETAE